MRADEYLEGVRAIMARAGHAVQGVLPTQHEPGWSYTIGLWPKHGHELLLALVDHRTAVEILNRVAADVKAGLELPLDTPLEPCPPHGDGTINAWASKAVMFKRCDPALLADRVNVGRAIHGVETFPVLQMVIPDKQGLFPGQPGYSLRQQPILWRQQ